MTRASRSPLLALLTRLRLGASALHVSSGATVALCVSLWIRAKTVDQSERGNAERRALFVGLWPVWLWLLGNDLACYQRCSDLGWRRRGR